MDKRGSKNSGVESMGGRKGLSGNQRLKVWDLGMGQHTTTAFIRELMLNSMDRSWEGSIIRLL